AQDTGERIINGVPCSRGSHPWQVALYDNDEFQCAGVLVNQQWVLTVAHCHMRYGLHPAQDTGERIFNGVPCPGGSHPWQVALYDNKKFHCAGVLVNKQWVLTVAHCHQSEYIVQMGSDLLVDVRAQRIRATESFIHPWYINDTYYHDIMLVKLSSPATLSPTVRTIDLPSSCKGRGTSCTVSGWGFTTGDAGRRHRRTDNHDIMLVKLSSPATLSPTVNTTDLPSSCKAAGTSCTVSGWGVPTTDGAATNSSDLMCSNVNIISYRKCKRSYWILLKKYMLCAAPPPDGFSNSCKGDSGSPLICEGSLQGLVSSGYFPCTPPFEPVIYTRLCMYRKWVYKTIKANS
ncbi:Kallikrein-7, partial [Myotis davidii]